MLLDGYDTDHRPDTAVAEETYETWIGKVRLSFLHAWKHHNLERRLESMLLFDEELNKQLNLVLNASH